MFVQTQENLLAAVEAVKGSKFIVLDTEFLRDRTYYPKLCLIQFSDGSNHYVIDALAGLDLKPLTKLLFSKNLVKVIHSARQDMEVLYNYFGELPKNIFDTQVAMQFLGFQEPPSYEAVIGHYLAKKVDKKLQYSNWAKRPLDHAQLEYALADVVYLAHVYPKILRDLQAVKRDSWLKEECLQIEKFKNFMPTDLDLLNKFSNFLHTEQEFTRCLRIVRQREEIAKKLDAGRTRVLADEVVIKLSRSQSKPQEVESLYLKGFDKPRLDTIFSDLLLQKDEEQLIKSAMTNKRRRSPSRDSVFEVLKVLLHDKAKSENISSTLIANVDDLLQLCAGSKKTKLSKGWRKSFFGQTLADIVSGNLSIFIEKGKVCLGSGGKATNGC